MTAIDVLQNGDENIFPLVNKIIKILMTLPVNNERTFSY